MRNHLLPHRWDVVGVDWGDSTGHPSVHPHTRARAVCTRRGCEATLTREFPGANLTVKAARQAFSKWRRP